MSSPSSPSSALVPVPVFQAPPLQVSLSSAASKRSKDPLQQILSMSREEIFNGLLSPDLLRTFAEVIYRGLKGCQFKLNLSNATSWAYGEDMDDKQFLYTILKPFSSKLFWKPGDSIHREKIEHDRVILLEQLYRVHRCFEIPEDHPAKQVLLKLMDCLIEGIAIDDNKQNATHFPVASLFASQSKALLCFKTPSGWACGHYARIENIPTRTVNINNNKTKFLCFDQAHTLIDYPCCIVSAQFRCENDLRTEAVFRTRLAKIPPGPLFDRCVDDYVRKKIKKMVSVDFCFYRGAAFPYDLQRNAITYNANIDLRNKQPVLIGLGQDAAFSPDGEDLVTASYTALHLEKIGEIFSVFREKIIEPFKKAETDFVTFQITPPSNQRR